MIQCIGMMEVLETLKLDGGLQITTKGVKRPHAVIGKIMDDGLFIR